MFYILHEFNTDWFLWDHVSILYQKSQVKVNYIRKAETKVMFVTLGRNIGSHLE